MLLICAGFGGCVGNNGERNDRAKMEQATLKIKGRPFNVAVARGSLEQQLGLMNVTSEELGPDQGMLFVFTEDRPLNFWMKNTLIDLDIAYIAADLKIARIQTMKALDLSTYPSGQAVRYALEVRAGRFAALSIREGDTVEIPETVLKR